MKYFLDTEFHEYQKKPLFGKPIDTIELISIGIVSEDYETTYTYGTSSCPLGTNIQRHVAKTTTNKEYYAICKEFDIKAAWNNEWLRENVLKSIWLEMQVVNPFSYKTIKKLINKYGKTRKQIAEEIKEFASDKFVYSSGNPHYEIGNPEFYAYYADYDWVVFCWLFGRMIDLPKGFPMYCKDLKQMYDEKVSLGIKENMERIARGIDDNPYLYKLKERENYPKQTNEHNALEDAKWNYTLYKFLNTI